MTRNSVLACACILHGNAYSTSVPTESARLCTLTNTNDDVHVPSLGGLAYEDERVEEPTSEHMRQSIRAPHSTY